MISAIDTNIFLDILLPNEEFYDSSSDALQMAATLGSLVICDIVYAELSVHFASQRECDTFLRTNEIRVQPLNQEALFLAGRKWRTYRKKGGKRTRILADFLIGAHAQIQASRLLSRDRGFYSELFPSLRVIDPSAQTPANGV